MSLSLNDALSHYRSVSDATHKFWGYFHVVAVATVGYAWAQQVAKPQDLQALFWLLEVAFGVFAILNGILVVTSQAEAVNAADCIKAFAAKVDVPVELKPIIDRIKPYPALLVCVWHVVLSLAALAAIWWRFHRMQGN